MQQNLITKKLNFIVVSAVLAALLFVSGYLGQASMPSYLVILTAISFFALVWSLELAGHKRLWLNASVLPLNLIVGAVLSLFQFPNLSFYIKIAFVISIAILFYIALLVTNIFIVVETRGKMIPLFRAALTWAQILIVISCIPLYSSIFKLAMHPALQALAVIVSSYLLFSLWGWVLKLETGEADKSLILVSSFWVAIFAFNMLFIPFEAIFRGLFLSSIVLFGLGFIQNYLKHTITRKIIIEHVVITILFLLLGLLFIP